MAQNKLIPWKLLVKTALISFTSNRCVFFDPIVMLAPPGL